MKENANNKEREAARKDAEIPSKQRIVRKGKREKVDRQTDSQG